MSRFITLACGSFLTQAYPKETPIDNKTIRRLLGILQDCMIMAAVVMFGMGLTLLIGS